MIFLHRCFNALKLTTIAFLLAAAHIPATPAPVSAQDKPVVYLTFDDGPNFNTATYLDLLDTYNAKATFFVTGRNTTQHPGLARSIVTRGHAIANHSFDHASLATLPDASIHTQLTDTNQAIESATGLTTSCYRPPYGHTNARVHAVAGSVGLTNSGWTTSYRSPHWGGWDVDTSDYRGSQAYVSQQLSTIQGGDVVLMHDIHSTAYTPLAAWLAANGDRFDFRPLPGCRGALVEPTMDQSQPELWYRFGVARLYLAYFDRMPDDDGWAYWNGVIVRGGNLRSVSDEFARSPEYEALAGISSNREFVSRVYQVVMKRQADVAGLAYWSAMVSDGSLTRGQLMVQFSESPEFIASAAPTLTGDCFSGPISASYQCAAQSTVSFVE